MKTLTLVLLFCVSAWAGDYFDTKILRLDAENIKKMEEQGPEMESQELTALKYATETRLKLISKYLPDLKSQEITGEAGDSLQVTVADFSSANKHSE